MKPIFSSNGDHLSRLLLNQSTKLVPTFKLLFIKTRRTIERQTAAILLYLPLQVLLSDDKLSPGSGHSHL